MIKVYLKDTEWDEVTSHLTHHPPLPPHVFSLRLEVRTRVASYLHSEAAERLSPHWPMTGNFLEARTHLWVLQKGPSPPVKWQTHVFIGGSMASGGVTVLWLTNVYAGDVTPGLIVSFTCSDYSGAAGWSKQKHDNRSFPPPHHFKRICT